MQNQITCPHCHQSFEPTQAYKHELEATLLRDVKTKHQLELEKLQKEAEAKHEQELQKALEKAALKAQESVEKELKDQLDQIATLKKRAQQAEEQELKMRREKRELEEAKRQFEVKVQRQLDEERQKIREITLKQAQEEQELKGKEKDKVIADLQRALADAQRKAHQGSQQTQGEVMELELEALLRREFPLDQITEVKKGQRGADVVQAVIDRRGSECGTILWESKNAKWQPSWVATLKENQRQAKAQVAVLLASQTPEDIESFTFQDGIWIANRRFAVPLAMALRYDLIRVNMERMANLNKSEKAEVLYQYITSTEFKHRVEAIVETFADMQETIEKEKRWFTAKWAKQEKQIRRVVDNTVGMRADLEGMLGNVLPAVDFLQLEDGEVE